MDYTKAQRRETYSANYYHKELTIDRLLELGITREQIASSTYTLYNKQRIRLVNQDPQLNKVKALYLYNKETVNQLQHFYNVGPYTNESISCNNKHYSRRCLDLYLSKDDQALLIAQPATIQQHKLPEA